MSDTDGIMYLLHHTTVAGEYFLLTPTQHALYDLLPPIHICISNSVAVVIMEEGTPEVAQGATHQKGGPGGHTLALQRDVGPTRGPGLVPRKCPSPLILSLPLGTGLFHSQTTVTSRGAGHLPGHLLTSAPSLPWLETEVRVVPGPLICRIKPCFVALTVLSVLNQFIIHCVRKQLMVS